MPDFSGAQQAQPSLGDLSNSGSAAHEGGADLDFQDLFSQQQQELQTTKKTAERSARDLDALRQKTEQSEQTMAKLRAALTGEDEGGVGADPYAAEIAGLEGQLDEYLQAAIDHERKGTPIPLTINSAVNSIKFQIRALQKEKVLEERNKKLEAQIAQLSNPANAIDQTAYSNIDSAVINSLNSVFGAGDEYADQKNAQFQAVTAQIADEIRDLKTTDPDMWDRIRRDRNAQVKLVNHFIKKNIPPKARQLMEEDEIKRTPLSYDELMNAFREAKELAASGKDPRAQQMVSQIRQELLSRVWDKNAGKSSRVRTSELF